MPGGRVDPTLQQQQARPDLIGARDRILASKKRWRDRQPPAYHAAEARRKKAHFDRNKNAINEARRAKEARRTERRKQEYADYIEEIFGAGKYVCSVVSEYELLHDRTRWSGPGRAREERLATQADHLLRAAARVYPEKHAPSDRRASAQESTPV